MDDISVNRDTVEVHYSCLEQPCACLDGFHYIGHMVESPDDPDGEAEIIEAVKCRRCA